MMHLGRHFNLVNLLGAVTENIEQSGLMIIVELCEFGDIEILLRNNRKYFIDQINHENDTIDATICAKDQGDQEGQRSSTESLENDGYKTLTKPHPITTSDLLCWAFQVARGMHYLISHNVLHRDLATRNILLCANNVVKICDFGLAKSLHNKPYYRKNGGERVPYRWLAPESLIDQKYSVHSDVWSFGIVLWELFSLGLMPYSKLDDPFNNLANFLQRGNRLSKPEYATQSIYDIMMSCWNADPNARPLFDSLAMTFCDLMKPDDLEEFIDLNKSFMEKNAEKYKSEENDCLASVKLDENPENDENTTQSCVVDVLSPENPNGNAECVVEIPLKTIV
ncbi:vascular endothelial growth factor receptor 1-like [Contarinia nasturtii]|uniref:vascular endothelial growth factor receptor 1-like n=1 Tax=Contarinia nasturtii TaxID=265458 RepID=UPI0012D3BCEF|nr:vascular endothelial growth factor receptor 1-like [Contarinia nasturtii]XP_031626916.1 vascular endothelial growth factor receptor 1-like [Contarinia nasturtii]